MMIKLIAATSIVMMLSGCGNIEQADIEGSLKYCQANDARIRVIQTGACFGGCMVGCTDGSWAIINGAKYFSVINGESQ